MRVNSELPGQFRCYLGFVCLPRGNGRLLLGLLRGRGWRRLDKGLEARYKRVAVSLATGIARIHVVYTGYHIPVMSRLGRDDQITGSQGDAIYPIVRQLVDILFQQAVVNDEGSRFVERGQVLGRPSCRGIHRCPHRHSYLGSLSLGVFTRFPSLCTSAC